MPGLLLLSRGSQENSSPKSDFPLNVAFLKASVLKCDWGPLQRLPLFLSCMCVSQGCVGSVLSHSKMGHSVSRPFAKDTSNRGAILCAKPPTAADNPLSAVVGRLSPFSLVRRLTW